MSSDSEEEVQIKKPKSSGVRGRRGFSHKQSGNSGTVGPISASSAVYSSCVSKCFSNIKSNSDVKRALSESTNDDVEDDITSICTAKVTVPELKKVDTILLSDDECLNENSQDIMNTCTPSCSRNTNMNANSILSPSPPPPPELSQKSRRRRGGKQKKTLLSAVSALTKNLSDAQSQLKETTDFQSPEPEVCIIDDEDEVTVRVEIRDKVHRYMLPSNEMLSSVVSSIAAEQKVPERLVWLIHKDRTLRPTDTPTSIQLRTADIIKCHITNEEQVSINDGDSDDDDGDRIELVIQTQGSKHRDLIKIARDKPMIVLMKKYVKLVKQREEEKTKSTEEKTKNREGEDQVDKEILSRLQFKFDGEILGQKETPASLDMDDGDIVEVYQQSVTVIC